MKVLSIMLMMLLASCAKENNNPDYVDVQVYKSAILHTNTGEPDKLFTYVYQDKNDYWIANTTSKERDLSTLDWKKQSTFPQHVEQYFIERIYPDLKVKRIIITKS